VCLALDGTRHYRVSYYTQIKDTLSNILPVCPVHGHVCFDDAVDANPSIFSSIAQEGNFGVTTHETSATISTDKIFAAGKSQLLSIIPSKRK
jgi:hypothetical protein